MKSRGVWPPLTLCGRGGHISRALRRWPLCSFDEDGELDLSNTVGKWIQEVPEAWKGK